MKLIVQGKNIEITEAIRAHVDRKIGKAMTNFVDLVSKVDVELSVPRSLRGQPQQIAEVTVYAQNNIIRAEERHTNLYASIELAANKIVRQLKRYKEKRHERSSAAKVVSEIKSVDSVSSNPEPDNVVPIDSLNDRTPTLPAKVLRNKFFAMPPMAVQEALENLQLVDHDFYMFHNSDTGKINVIYERNHGGYGLIQPRKED